MTRAPAPLRVIVADDHALFRQGLISLLTLIDEVVVVGQAQSIADLQQLLEQTACDVLLLDLGMERNSTVEISALAERVKAVVVVTASEQPGDAIDAIRSGARAVVFKRFAVETLMDAIHAAIDGNIWMPPSVQTHTITNLRQGERDALTQREREIVRHVALGLRNAEVARRLCISEPTVKTHLTNIFTKLGVRDRVELTLYAARMGIIGVNDRPDS